MHPTGLSSCFTADWKTGTGISPFCAASTVLGATPCYQHGPSCLVKEEAVEDGRVFAGLQVDVQVLLEHRYGLCRAQLVPVE